MRAKLLANDYSREQAKVCEGLHEPDYRLWGFVRPLVRFQNRRWPGRSAAGSNHGDHGSGIEIQYLHAGIQVADLRL